MSIRIQYGHWTVTEIRGKKALCTCSCGTQKEVWVNNLTSGKSKSCGHVRNNYTRPALGDLIGEWLVLENIDDRHVLAECSCGLQKKLYVYSLGKDSTSCGHLRKTGPRSRLTWMWKWMHSRCGNPGDPMFPYYGGRGIKVCLEWHDVNAYINWAIENGWSKSAGLQIDRKDNDGDYSPTNCRVVDKVTNANNKSNNRKVTAFGETKTVAEWSRDHRCVVSYATLWQRVSVGWDGEDALTRPVSQSIKLQP